MSDITKFNPENEPILKISNDRFVLFPIRYPDIYKLYKDSLSAFWVVEEVDLSIDKQHFQNKLTENERFFIKNILAFFACSDGIVNENLALNFYNEVQIPEARNLYATQIQIEAIHSEMYSLLIDGLVTDAAEKTFLFNSIETSPIIKKKADWSLKWFDTERSFPERLMAFGIVEGIFFSGSFCAIFWLKSRALMPGLGLSNEFISRDESMHCRTCVLLYSKLNYQIPEETVHSLFMEAYLIEKEFITESIPVNLIGMNSKSMVEYIEYICDYWLSEFGYNKLFGTRNPFDFMEYISLESKTNFFEKGVSNYSKAGSHMTPEQMAFSTEEDF
jgi:ribonucleoside-diphosphate reductase beta chain